MIDFLLSMGPYLVPLVIFSIYSWGLILQKAGEFRRARPLGHQDFSALVDALAQGAPTHLAADHPLAPLLVPDVPEHRQARALARLGRLEERLSYFPALANLATLTGLLGTVIGMVMAFLALRSGGGADPSSLAGGLGQALVATALGLVTAIPALWAHAYFQKRVASLSSQMEVVLTLMLRVTRDPAPPTEAKGG